MTGFECSWCGGHFKEEEPRYIDGAIFCAECAEDQEIYTALFTSFTCVECGKYIEKDIPCRESGKLYCNPCWYNREREKARQYSSYTCYMCDYVYPEEPPYISSSGKLLCNDCRILHHCYCGKDMLQFESHSKLGNIVCRECWEHYISIKDRK